jgi:hypothetical protein
VLDAATGAVEPWQPNLDADGRAFISSADGAIVGGGFSAAGTRVQSYLAQFAH